MFQHLKSTDVSGKQVACFHTGFFPGLFFDPEDRGNMFQHLMSTDVSGKQVACFHTGSFPGLFFDSEDGGNVFHQNVG
jgi:hypothetical protein